MTIRRAIFWLHLSAGVISGAVIFAMSITGVLLTYEKQIITLAERQFYSDPKGETRLTADQLVLRAQEASPAGRRVSVVLQRHPKAPVIVQAGRGSKLLIDPYSGEVLGAGAENVEGFFKWVTEFHRWFALKGEARQTGRNITGAANLLFLFLILTGIYIWLPKIWHSQILQNKLFFQGRYPSGKARDYNWHNVIGIWSAIPLVLIVATAVIFSYPWAHTLVFKAYGEQPPQRMQRGGPPDRLNSPQQDDIAAPDDLLSYQELLEKAQNFDPKWKRISLTPVVPTSATINVTVDTGTGGEPFKQKTLTYDRTTGDVLKIGGAAQRSKGMQARIFIRFLHTGESYGLLGQTIAGLVSLGACFLVYTGLALAYRRLVRPLLQQNTSNRG